MSSSRLQTLDLVDFTGGLVADRSQFTLGDNESPRMLNMEVDPRGGFYTRRGWARWNADDIVVDPTTWDPRNGALHLLADGAYDVYVVTAEPPTTPNSGPVYVGDAGGVFAVTTVGGNAAPHLVDFASWGDVMYFATGQDAAAIGSGPRKRDGNTGVVSTLADASLAYNDDYTNPLSGTFPYAEFLETHSGYMFCAAIRDGVGTQWNRIRWSHPDQPEDWATDDFIDIERGGGRITGLLSFRDHLLIFKTDSIWALYGYDRDTWQLVQISVRIGVPAPTAFTRSETAVYFYSAADSGGIYAYEGQQPVDLSRAVDLVVRLILDHDKTYLAWVGNRLWCSLPVPFSREVGGGEELLVAENTVMVFDPLTGNGAWVRHAPAIGALGPFIPESDIASQLPLVTLRGNSGVSCLLQLESHREAYDVISESYVGDPPGHPFFSAYRTGWKHAGWIERRKSWLRPRFVARIPVQEVRLRLDVYWDYEEYRIHRSGARAIQPSDSILWTVGGSADPDGADWGEADAEWGSGQTGATLIRLARSLGVARAIQLDISGDSSTPGRAWGIDAIHLPYNFRRYTT